MSTLEGGHAAQARIASSVNILLGIWLIVSPWVFHYSTNGPPAILNSVIVGAFIAVLAATRLAAWRDTAPLSALNLVLALWIIASPWVEGYAANVGGVRDNVILGVVIAALAVGSGGATIAEEKHPPGTPAH
jgi:SPW repeat-containing protein